MPGSSDRLYLHLNSLYESIQRHPDRCALPSELRAPAIQATYVVSGCDYTSFLEGLGKSTFFDALFRFASFICEPIRNTGHNIANSLMLIRLVACAYYMKHKSLFNTTPENLFAELRNEECNSEDQHKEFRTLFLRLLETLLYDQK